MTRTPIPTATSKFEKRGQEQVPAQAMNAPASATRHACRILDVGPWVAGEHASIRHLDRAQGAGVERRIGRKQTIQTEDVGGDGIDIIVAERLRRVLRHRAANIVEQRRGIGPVTADRLDRLRRRDSALAADQPIADTTLTLLAMTGHALLLEHLPAMGNAAASGRKVGTVPADIDIPAGNFR